MTRPMPRLVGISGYARSGKDSFADALVERIGYLKKPFTDPINEILLQMNPHVGFNTLVEVVAAYGWERAKDRYPKVRELQQALGNTAREVLGAGVWVDAAMRAVDTALHGYGPDSEGKGCPPDPSAHFVFPNVRYQNEFDAIKARGGIVVRIEREGVGPVNGHVSENNIDDAEFDYVIHNDGSVSDLRQKAFDVVAKEMGTYVWPKPVTCAVHRLGLDTKILLVPRGVEVRRNHHNAAFGRVVAWTGAPEEGFAPEVSNPLTESNNVQATENISENGYRYSPAGSSSRDFR